MDGSPIHPSGSTFPLLTRKYVDKKPCSVCGEAGDGAHFGAEACRACAAFFRRSVALQKKYTCRNNGQCPIESTIRCMCRACRYEKCLKEGMRKTAVQRHRDMLGKREEECSKSESDCPNMEKGPVSEDAGMPTLCRLRENYRLMDNIRKVLHNREGDSVFAKREPRVVDYKEANEINKKEVGLIADFLVNSFPQDFGSISAEQKTILYRNFFLNFIMLETGYFCALKNRTDIFFLSTGDYIDTTRPETFYIDTTGNQPMSTEDAVKIFAPSFSIYRRNLLEPMRSQKIEDIEFFALCSFVLWDHGLEGQTEECESIAVKVRQRVVEELIFYYRHVKKYKEPADRLSNMMILLPPLQRAVRRFQEDVEISHVFRAYAVPDDFHEIINGRF